MGLESTEFVIAVEKALGLSIPDGGFRGDGAHGLRPPTEHQKGGRMKRAENVRRSPKVPHRNRNHTGWWIASFIERFEYYDENKANLNRDAARGRTRFSSRRRTVRSPIEKPSSWGGNLTVDVRGEHAPLVGASDSRGRGGPVAVRRGRDGADRRARHRSRGGARSLRSVARRLRLRPHGPGGPESRAAGCGDRRGARPAPGVPRALAGRFQARDGRQLAAACRRHVARRVGSGGRASRVREHDGGRPHRRARPLLPRLGRGACR